MNFSFDQSLSIMHNLLAEAEVHHTSCGDGTMVWRRWGHGKPLVLLHGGSGSWTHWIKTIPAFRDDYTLWVADLPGLGDSAMPHQPYTPKSCATALVNGFKQLVNNSAPASMVCFSFGCHVGTLAATELNDHLSELVITGSAALGLDQAQSISLPKERKEMTDNKRREVHHTVLSKLMFANAANIDEQAIALQALNVSNARFRSREFANSADVKNALARISVPVKSIWGESDIVARPDPDACLKVLRLYHPELQHRIIKGAGHWVMYEAAEEFNAALRELLTS